MARRKASMQSVTSSRPLFEDVSDMTSKSPSWKERRYRAAPTSNGKEREHRTDRRPKRDIMGALGNAPGIVKVLVIALSLAIFAGSLAMMAPEGPRVDKKHYVTVVDAETGEKYRIETDGRLTRIEPVE